MGTKARPLLEMDLMEKTIAETSRGWMMGRVDVGVCLCNLVCCVSSSFRVPLLSIHSAAVPQTKEDEHSDYDGRDTANHIFHFLIIFQVCFLASLSDLLMELPVLPLNPLMPTSQKSGELDQRQANLVWPFKKAQCGRFTALCRMCADIMHNYVFIGV